MTESFLGDFLPDDLALRLKKLSEKLALSEDKLIGHALTEYLQSHEVENDLIGQKSSEGAQKALVTAESDSVDQKARTACQTLLQRIELLEKELNQTILDVKKLKEYDRKQDEEDMVSPVLGW